MTPLETILKEFDELVPPLDEDFYRATHKYFAGEPGTARETVILEEDIQHKKRKRKQLRDFITSVYEQGKADAVREILKHQVEMISMENGLRNEVVLVGDILDLTKEK